MHARFNSVRLHVAWCGGVRHLAWRAFAQLGLGGVGDRLGWGCALPRSAWGGVEKDGMGCGGIKIGRARKMCIRIQHCGCVDQTHCSFVTDSTDLVFSIARWSLAPGRLWGELLEDR